LQRSPCLKLRKHQIGLIATMTNNRFGANV
jgi:hypothetical protein